MLNIAYAHASVVLVIFHYYMLQNKQSNRYSLYTVRSVVVVGWVNQNLARIVRFAFLIEAPCSQSDLTSL